MSSGVLGRVNLQGEVPDLGGVSGAPVSQQEAFNAREHFEVAQANLEVALSHVEQAIAVVCDRLVEHSARVLRDEISQSLKHARNISKFCRTSTR